MLILAACATTTGLNVSDAPAIADNKPLVACAVFQPIYWSEIDTVETIIQAKEHNAVWSRLCSQTKSKEKMIDHEPS